MERASAGLMPHGRLHSFRRLQISSLFRFVYWALTTLPRIRSQQSRGMSMIPVLGWGIRIHHCNADCPKRVIFWYLGNPDTVLRGIRDSGFLPVAPISASPYRRGIAMRWSAIIIAIAAWNALFFLGAGHTSGVPPHPGPLILAPLLFAFALSVGTLISPKLQRIILKPGRSVGEIRPFLRLLAFISGLLLVIISILLASGAFTNAPGS